MFRPDINLSKNIARTKQNNALITDTFQNQSISLLQWFGIDLQKGSNTLVLAQDGTWVANTVFTGWNLTGNSGTDFTVNYVGTKDGEPLLIKANSDNTIIRVGDGVRNDIITVSDSFQVKDATETSTAIDVQNGLTPVITIGDALVVGNSTTIIVDDPNKKILLKGDYTDLNSGQKVRTRVHTIAPAVTVTVNDYIVIVNKTVGAATTVNLPAGITGTTYIIKDGKGDATANPITVTPTAGTIDGVGSFIIGGEYRAVTFVYNGTEWNVISDYTV